MKSALKGLIFDVDGTLAETEEVHRASFNTVFERFGLDWHWSKETYRKLLTTTGGKERMARFAADEKSSRVDAKLIAYMHKAKNELYAGAIAKGELQLRPGVRSLVRDAAIRGLKLGIATTTSRSNLDALMQACFSEEEQRYFEALVCGEDVAAKKPNPDAYLQGLAKLGLQPDEVLAIEDSVVGLAAARAAQIPTIITPGIYTIGDDFRGALAVVTRLPNDIDQLKALASARARQAASLPQAR